MILKKLSDQGFECFLAGGAVRDLLMGNSPGDLDIATSAKPDEVESFFPHTVSVGKAFGVIRVIDQGHSIEVATYRKDLDYHDGRRPEGVVFTNRVEDAKRRDFTINALFYDPINEVVYDDVDGKKDIDAKLLKCVGNAAERFQEDELRRLRLVRFVSQLGFQIEDATLKALQTGIEGIQKISKERITEEVGKMWMGVHLKTAFKVWMDSGMAGQVDPAWERFTATAPAEIWNLPREEKNKAYAHYFSFFFDEENFKNHFKNFKLSKETENFVLSVYEAYHEIPNFLKSRFGEQRYLAGQKGFLLGLLYYLVKKANKDEGQKLRQIYQNFENKILPQPLIKAQHLQPKYQGAELGRALKLIYIEQLHQDWTDEPTALDWISKNIDFASK